MSEINNDIIESLDAEPSMEDTDNKIDDLSNDKSSDKDDESVAMDYNDAGEIVFSDVETLSDLVEQDNTDITDDLFDFQEVLETPEEITPNEDLELNNDTLSVSDDLEFDTEAAPAVEAMDYNQNDNLSLDEANDAPEAQDLSAEPTLDVYEEHFDTEQSTAEQTLEAPDNSDIPDIEAQPVDDISFATDSAESFDSGLSENTELQDSGILGIVDDYFVAEIDTPAEMFVPDTTDQLNLEPDITQESMLDYIDDYMMQDMNGVIDASIDYLEQKAEEEAATIDESEDLVEDTIDDTSTDVEDATSSSCEGDSTIFDDFDSYVADTDTDEGLNDSVDIPQNDTIEPDYNDIDSGFAAD